MEVEKAEIVNDDICNDGESYDWLEERERGFQELIKKQIEKDRERRERIRKDGVDNFHVWDSVTNEKMSLKKYERIYGPYLRRQKLKAERNNDGRLTDKDFKLARRVIAGALKPSDFDYSGLKRKDKVIPLKKETQSYLSEPHVENKARRQELSEEPKKLREAETPSVRRERQPGDDYFLKTERGLIKNAAYRKLFKGPGTVYEFLWQNIVRAKMVKDKFHIKENYDDKGLLAYSTSYRHIAKECFMDKDYVKKVIKEFKDAGIIFIESVVPEGGKRPQNVYILGTWKKIDGKRVEHFFRDAVFLTNKVREIEIRSYS